MKTCITAFGLGAMLGLAATLLTGCASTDSESDSSQISGGVYYGMGFYDPWYYGAPYYHAGVIVTPPPARVDPPHVEHYSASPPPAARPTPSIPMGARPAFRR